MSREIAYGDHDGGHLSEGRRPPNCRVARSNDGGQEARERSSGRAEEGEEGPRPCGRRRTVLPCGPCRVQDLGRSLPPLDGLDEAPPVVLVDR